MPYLYKVTHSMRFLGQTCLNRYYYVDSQDLGTAESLATLFAENIAPLVASIQAREVEHKAVAVEEIANGLPGHTVLFDGLLGQRSGTTLPSHDAYGLQLLVATAYTRSGAKRIPGIREDDQNQGDVSEVWQAILDAVARVLASYLYDAVTEYFPVIIKELTGGWGLNAISSGQYKRITTQNSRKQYTNPGEFAVPGMGTLSYSSVTAPAATAAPDTTGWANLVQNSTIWQNIGWPVGVADNTPVITL